MTDLHLHTNLSDGTDSPCELISKLRALGCDLFSVTDHDDISSCCIVQTELSKETFKINFITGVEISAVYDNKNLHLLCYNFYVDASIKDLVNEVKQRRRKKIMDIIEHLRINHAIIIHDETIAEILSRDVPGKPHVVDAVVKQGINMTQSQIYDNCINDMETRCYKINADKVIDAVHKAGGVVSFAHPIEVQKEYGIDFTELSAYTKKLKDIGLDSLEVYHSSHDRAEVKKYSELADKFNLLVSSGSDYHGENKPVSIGQLTAYGYVPDDKLLTILSAFNFD